jgi:hypothetical protein
MTSSVDLNFTQITTAAIILGQSFFTMRTRERWEKLCEDLDRLGNELDLPLALLVSADLSWPGFSRPDPGEEIDAGGLVGLVVASTDDPYPHEVPWRAFEAALDRAASVPWDRIAALIAPIAYPGSLLDGDPKLWAGATGPLAGGYLAFGVQADDESELLEWSAGSPQSKEPNLAFVAGKDMNQRRVERGVWGMRIEYNGDWGASVLDLSSAARAQHIARLGTLGPEGRYYLMACYD